MAKNRNLLAGYTVEALQQVTRDVQEPFVLPTMVDRIAAMLNYVLKQLVGPKRKELNVSGFCMWNDCLTYMIFIHVYFLLIPVESYDYVLV